MKARSQWTAGSVIRITLPVMIRNQERRVSIALDFHPTVAAGRQPQGPRLSPVRPAHCEVRHAQLEEPGLRHDLDAREIMIAAESVVARRRKLIEALAMAAHLVHR